ncbi:MAG TPA: hypothetical protein VGC66_12420 [Pyrinomonadaceae bacterium]|jgi:hypothetical protein
MDTIKPPLFSACAPTKNYCQSDNFHSRFSSCDAVSQARNYFCRSDMFLPAIASSVMAVACPGYAHPFVLPPAFLVRVGGNLLFSIV